MRQGFADADGVRIAWTDHGGDGPALVLVHATGFHAGAWDPWLADLTPRFRVVTLDQRGHGASDKPAEGYVWDNFALDVLAVADALSLDAPMAAGHSAGAVAVLLAETSAPGRFSRVALMDPVIPDPELKPFMTGDANPMVAQAARRRSVWDSREQFVDRLHNGSPLQRWTQPFLDAYAGRGLREAEGRFELVCPPAIESQIYANNGTHDGWERLPLLRCPALVVTGEHSHMWPANRVDLLRAQTPSGTVKVLPGGHFFPMEHPDETLAVLLDFLTA